MTSHRTCLALGRAVVSASLLALLPSRASAQNAPDQAAAEALFKQGRDMMVAGQYASACPKFVESERLDPAPGTLLNLATCYEKSGQIASAWVTYKEAATAARNADQTERARLARDKAAELEPNLPMLTIVVPPASDRPDLKVRRDGEAVGRAEWGTPIPVDPGTHVVDATAPGARPWQTSATIAGSSAKVSVEIPVLEAVPQAAPPVTQAPPAPAPLPPVIARPLPAEAPPDPRAGSAQRALAWTTGGVGVAGLVAGSIFGGLALSRKNAAEAQCVAQNVCDSTSYDADNGAKSDALASTIAFAAGGALLAAGIVLYVTSPRARRTPSTAITIAPFAGPGAAGGSLRGSW